MICWGNFNIKKGNRPGRQPRRAHHQGPRQVPPTPPPPPEERRRWTFLEQIWEDSVEGCTYIAWNHHYSFQKGSSPAQDSKRMQGWLKETFTEVWVEEVWPPSSPYCKPLDYFLCGVSELWAHAKSRNKSKDLIQKMMEVIEVVFTADWQFYWISYFPMCISANYFLLH